MEAKMIRMSKCASNPTAPSNAGRGESSREEGEEPSHTAE